jgi:hypothetical protein
VKRRVRRSREKTLHWAEDSGCLPFITITYFVEIFYKAPDTTLLEFGKVTIGRLGLSRKKNPGEKNCRRQSG